MSKVALRRFLLTVAIAIGVMAGCAGAPQTPAPASGAAPPAATPSTPADPQTAPPQTSPPPVDSAAVADARQQMETADFADPASIDEAGSAVRFTRAGEEASRAILESPDSDATALWMALWVYGSAGTDPEPLRPLLSNDDASIRIMAAAILLSLGDDSAFEAVREALAADTLLTGSEPPIPIRQYGINTLTRYVTGADVPQPAEEVADEDDGSGAAREWEAWLSANVDRLVFDQPSATWAVP